jgi:hypothetical protein
MRSRKPSIDDQLDRVIDKSVKLMDKSIEASIPVMSGWLSQFESWLDTKLEDPERSKSTRS